MASPAGKITPEVQLAYTKMVGGTETAWNALELAATGMQLPPAFSARWLQPRRPISIRNIWRCATA